MKKLFFLFAGLLFIGCQTEVKKDYVTFSGKIANKNSDSVVLSKKGFKKVIAVNEDGTFSDTLKVDSDFYTFYDGGEYTRLFLKNGYDLQMTLDTEQFDESVAYTGEGADNNNYIAEEARMKEKLLDFEIDNMDAAALDSKLADVSKELNAYLDKQSALDTAVVNNAKSGIARTVKSYKGYLGDLIALRTNLPKGAPSPTFSNYENHAGGTTSLEELKGKYVYIDVWATWCGPCKAEIPHLKEVEADYHDKNIEFVSVSIDRPKDHEKWVAMVNDKELKGVQLFADSDWESKFVKDYYIKGIPRFILIDPDGNIISPDAPRPSNPKLRTMLDEMTL
ncbi:MAG: TlpA family protein disulfide reductase [Flavobacteriaceae bacterium]|nr:TlpA family protein disulfide reductase [Flavobacteriaceae bacterium]